VVEPDWASSIKFAADIVKLVSAVPDDRGRLHLICVNSKGEVLDSMQPTPNGGTHWTELKKIL
jgi:hypothetical protein